MQQNTALRLVSGNAGALRIWELSMKEKDFCKNKITPWLKSQGIYYFKPRGGPYSTRPGVADYILCINGQFIALEAKTDTGKQTAFQKEDEANVLSAGGRYILIRPGNWEFVKDDLEGLMHQINPFEN